ncbi:MAG: hypothetical protein SGPRY_009273, partial [Prymnesium sp.]
TMIQLERLLVQVVKRNSADNNLIKISPDKVYKMLKQVAAMKSEDAALVMLNDTNPFSSDF